MKSGTAKNGPRERTIVLAGFLLTFAGAPLFTLTVFFSSLEAEFGWSRAQISLAHTTFLLVAAASGIIIGWFADKYGARRPLLACAVLFGVGFSLVSRSHSLGQFIAFYAVTSVGSAATFVIPTAMVQSRVTRRIGLAIGITTAGVAVGRLVFTPMESLLISNYGWRTTFLFLAAADLVLITLAGILISPPGKEGAASAAGPPSATANAAGGEKGVATGKASLWALLKTKEFLIVALLFFFPAMPNQMVQVHIVPFAEGKGISGSTAALGAGLIAAFGVVGTIVWPSMAGRLGWKRLVFITAMSSALVTLWLLITGSLWMFFFFVVLYGFCYNGNIPARLGLLREQFGARFLASVIGVLVAISSIMGAFGPLIAGYIYDHMNSYSLAFVIAAAFWAAMGLTALLVKGAAGPEGARN